MNYLDMEGFINTEMLTQLTKLKYLNLAHNRLRYEIPDVAPSIYLKMIELNDNLFEGKVPEAWNNLYHLEYISLANNKFGKHSRGNYPVPIFKNA